MGSSGSDYVSATISVVLQKLANGPNKAAIATLAFITFVVLLPALFIGSLIVQQALEWSQISERAAGRCQLGRASF